MNPRSGGGKVGRFDLVAKAERLGAEVALLDGAEHIDVAELARAAVADGADLLGVAGGDGTQALVAGIAAEAGLPFLVISAGTRNHFAMDLGLDREHPDACLDALSDGIELEIDLGTIGGRTFVNNASFGAYADIVQSTAYRDDKRGTTLRLLPDVLSGQRGPRLVVHVDDETVIEAPQALLVSNNPYDLSDVAGLGHRPGSTPGVAGGRRGDRRLGGPGGRPPGRSPRRGMRRLIAHEVIVDADVPEIPVGIDGESVHDADTGPLHHPPPRAAGARALTPTRLLEAQAADRRLLAVAPGGDGGTCCPGRAGLRRGGRRSGPAPASSAGR